jgi:hypothetical protein
MLPIGSFHRDRNALDGHQGLCKDCVNERRRKRYADGGPYETDLYNGIRSRAQREGIAFSLTFEEFRELVFSPCVYGGGARPKVSVGIDRRNPRGGYSLENCVAACARHNRIKQDLFSFESMIQIVRTFSEARECGDMPKRTARKFQGTTVRRAAPRTALFASSSPSRG